MDYKLDPTKTFESEFRKAIAIIYKVLTALDKELQKRQVDKKYDDGKTKITTRINRSETRRR